LRIKIGKGTLKKGIMIMEDYEYDYKRFDDIITSLLTSSWREPEELEIGEDISNISEIKIIFDGYGDLEDEDENGEYRYTEGGNTNMESYAIFIHKDSDKENFQFPEHDTAWNLIIHRTKEEVCIYAWYDVENDTWDILPLEDRLDQECVMDENDVMRILITLKNRYYATE
jgi:hypothetical protein